MANGCIGHSILIVLYLHWLGTALFFCYKSFPREFEPRVWTCTLPIGR